MSLQSNSGHFSSQPGMHERHLQRKLNNPLFEQQHITHSDITAAQILDNQAHDRFMPDFNSLLQEVANLSGQVETETLNELKARLDKSYAQISALPGETGPFKQAIRKLITVITTSVMHNSEQDPMATSKLEDENAARLLHYDLQDLPLIADITNKDSPITEEELVPSLLSEQEAGLAAALPMFSKHQLLQIQANAEINLTALQAKGQDMTHGWQNLELISAAASAAPDDLDSVN